LFSDGSRASAVFEAKRRGGTEAIHYVRMQADGTWVPGKEALSPLTAATNKTSAPRLASGPDGTLYLVYVDGSRTVRLIRSKDGGVHWDAPLLVVERAEGTPPVTVRFPQVAVGGNTAYVMWEEWGESKSVIKNLRDAETKRPPLDLFIRRITFP